MAATMSRAARTMVGLVAALVCVNMVGQALADPYRYSSASTYPYNYEDATPAVISSESFDSYNEQHHGRHLTQALSGCYSAPSVALADCTCHADCVACGFGTATTAAFNYSCLACDTAGSKPTLYHLDSNDERGFCGTDVGTCIGAYGGLTATCATVDGVTVASSSDGVTEWCDMLMTLAESTECDGDATCKANVAELQAMFYAECWNPELTCGAGVTQYTSSAWDDYMNQRVSAGTEAEVCCLLYNARAEAEGLSCDFNCQAEATALQTAFGCDTTSASCSGLYVCPALDEHSEGDTLQHLCYMMRMLEADQINCDAACETDLAALNALFDCSAVDDPSDTCRTCVGATTVTAGNDKTVNDMCVYLEAQSKDSLCMADTTCAADLTLAYAMFPDCTRSGCGLCDGLMDVTGTAATETDLCTILTSLYGSGTGACLSDESCTDSLNELQAIYPDCISDYNYCTNCSKNDALMADVEPPDGYLTESYFCANLIALNRSTNIMDCDGACHDDLASLLGQISRCTAATQCSSTDAATVTTWMGTSAYDPDEDPMDATCDFLIASSGASASTLATTLGCLATGSPERSGVPDDGDQDYFAAMAPWNDVYCPTCSAAIPTTIDAADPMSTMCEMLLMHRNGTIDMATTAYNNNTVDDMFDEFTMCFDPADYYHCPDCNDMEVVFPSMGSGDYCDVLSWWRVNSTDCGAGMSCVGVTGTDWDACVEAFSCQDQVTVLFDGTQGFQNCNDPWGSTCGSASCTHCQAAETAITDDLCTYLSNERSNSDCNQECQDHVSEMYMVFGYYAPASTCNDPDDICQSCDHASMGLPADPADTTLCDFLRAQFMANNAGNDAQCDDTCMVAIDKLYEATSCIKDQCSDCDGSLIQTAAPSGTNLSAVDTSVCTAMDVYRNNYGASDLCNDQCQVEVDDLYNNFTECTDPLDYCPDATSLASSLDDCEFLYAYRHEIGVTCTGSCQDQVTAMYALMPSCTDVNPQCAPSTDTATCGVLRSSLMGDPTLAPSYAPFMMSGDDDSDYLPDLQVFGIHDMCQWLHHLQDDTNLCDSACQNRVTELYTMFGDRCVLTTAPSTTPTDTPTTTPTLPPTVTPTISPTTKGPTLSPTVSPTDGPTMTPTTVSPTASPTTVHPTSSPTFQCQECDTIDTYFGTVTPWVMADFRGGDFEKTDMCELLASLRSSSTCDHHCQDDVTTLYQSTDCVHTTCSNCGGTDWEVAKWETSTSKAVFQADVETSMCDLLFNLRTADYNNKTHKQQQEYSCTESEHLNKECQSEVDFMLTEYFPQCWEEGNTCFAGDANGDVFNCPAKSATCECAATTIQLDPITGLSGVKSWKILQGGSRTDPANFERWTSCEPVPSQIVEHITNCRVTGAAIPTYPPFPPQPPAPSPPPPMLLGEGGK